MAITSVDSYLLEQIKPRLHTVLSNCYIIDEVLKDFDYQTREMFKEAFCGKNAKHEVTVGFNFPSFKNNYEAHYLIQLGQGQEVKNSLGSIQGSYLEASGNTYSEQSVAIREGNRLVFHVSKPISNVIRVEDIAFDSYDDVKVSDNTVSFNYTNNETYEGYNANIVYVEKTNDSKGLVKGITIEEQVTIVGMSYNVDVARCLDAVLKMILISMRDSIEEQQTFQLQNLAFGDIAPIFQDGESSIFGRPTIIKYTSSLDLDYTITQDINKITFKNKGAKR
ncbi:hypothetical protein Koombakaat1_00174 [Staphylococcus phage Koomba-kaat_1]|nr:hypothetical protein Koombakaat1_00174 [Staphylococcus phage Koomba-kaat_1]